MRFKIYGAGTWNKNKNQPAAIEKLHGKIHIKKHYFLKAKKDLYIYHLKEVRALILSSPLTKY